MLRFDLELKARADALDRKEAYAFAHFLIAEEMRHQIDIQLIRRTLCQLAEKWGFDLTALRKNVVPDVAELEDFKPGGTD